MPWSKERDSASRSRRACHFPYSGRARGGKSKRNCGKPAAVAKARFLAQQATGHRQRGAKYTLFTSSVTYSEVPEGQNNHSPGRESGERRLTRNSAPAGAIQEPRQLEQRRLGNGPAGKGHLCRPCRGLGPFLSSSPDSRPGLWLSRPYRGRHWIALLVGNASSYL